MGVDGDAAADEEDSWASLPANELAEDAMWEPLGRATVESSSSLDGCSFGRTAGISGASA